MNKSIVISKSDFDAFNTSEFAFSVDETHREFTLDQYPIGVDDDGETEYSTQYSSFVAGEATAKHGELEISFYWLATGGSETYSDAFDFNIEIDRSARPYKTNFTIVDDDGDEIDGWDFDNILDEKLQGSGWQQLVQSLLPTAEIVDIDEVDAEKAPIVELQFDDGPNLRFNGTLVASAASSDNQAMGSFYSGQTGRWTELALYKTKGGKFVCQRVQRTRWQGGRDRFSGKICGTLLEVIEFFGHGWLAAELYSRVAV